MNCNRICKLPGLRVDRKQRSDREVSDMAEVFKVSVTV